MNELLSFFTPENPIYQLLIGLALGAFVGLRREIDNLSKKHDVFMGFRTMALMSTFGVITTLFSSMPYLPAIGFAGLMTFLAIAYANGTFRMKMIGITSELCAVMMFWIGVLVGYEQFTIAILLTILIGGLNAFKDELHKFAETISPKEWTGALLLLLVSGAVLPFLPTTPIDPLGIIVPFNIWFLVILISGIGFIGYFLTKYIGVERSVGLTAFVGSIVSSTAVTTSMAAQSKKNNLAGIYAVGVLIAVATMQVRVALVILALASTELTREIIIAPLVMAISAGLMAAFYLFRTNKKHHSSKKANPFNTAKVDLSSPFELGPALKFGGVFILVLLALTLGQRYLGDSGVYVAAFFSGFVDVDAIVLSSLESAKLEEMTTDLAGKAIMVAIVVNNLSKILYVAVLGNKKMVKKVAFGIIITSFVGVLAWMLW